LFITPHPTGIFWAESTKSLQVSPKTYPHNGQKVAQSGFKEEAGRSLHSTNIEINIEKGAVV
jgi:hypothetical protein